MNPLRSISNNQRLIGILLGRPGVGKGTQGKLISKEFNIPHISLGDLYRTECREVTNLGKLLNTYHQHNKDGFAPNEIAYGILAKRISQLDCKQGFILDGYPRTAEQVHVLISSFLRSTDILVPLYLDANEEIIRERVILRCICSQCGFQVGAHEKAAETMLCPQSGCGSKLEKRREDLDKDRLQTRFKFFDSEIQGVIEAFGQRKIYKISSTSNESVQQVFEKVNGVFTDAIGNSKGKQTFFSKKKFIIGTAAIATVSLLFRFFNKQASLSKA